ncbi:helix-turn-helix transcriptional regulator [Parasphingorhabdus sp.]|uniref:helix-turn-helix transcriptional regulator n=1 Tax=Parasphingorhabdus sp. TaxID=2709688 RepID=UPI003BAED048
MELTCSFGDNEIKRVSFLEAVKRVTIRSKSDVVSAALALSDFARSCAMRVDVIANIASNSPLVDANGLNINREIFNWTGKDEQWWDERGLALTSPLARACRCESEPMWYDSNGFYTNWDNDYLKSIKPTFHSSHSTYKHPETAILIPVHLPFGQIALAIYSPINEDWTKLTQTYQAYGESLATITRKFVAGYVSVMRRNHRLPINCELTKRQVSCLQWAAHGKTDKETAIIMSLSPATIRRHIKCAVERLDCVNRGQAISKAGQLGYLVPNN